MCALGHSSVRESNATTPVTSEHEGTNIRSSFRLFAIVHRGSVTCSFVCSEAAHGVCCVRLIELN